MHDLPSGDVLNIQDYRYPQIVHGMVRSAIRNKQIKNCLFSLLGSLSDGLHCILHCPDSSLVLFLQATYMEVFTEVAFPRAEGLQGYIEQQAVPGMPWLGLCCDGTCRGPVHTTATSSYCRGLDFEYCRVFLRLHTTYFIDAIYQPPRALYFFGMLETVSNLSLWSCLIHA